MDSVQEHRGEVVQYIHARCTPYVRDKWDCRFNSKINQYAVVPVCQNKRRPLLDKTRTKNCQWGWFPVRNSWGDFFFWPPQYIST